MNTTTAPAVRVCSWCDPPRLMVGERATVRATRAEMRRATHGCCEECIKKLNLSKHERKNDDA